jgi:CheY-like chemotaxis protein
MAEIAAAPSLRVLVVNENPAALTTLCNWLLSVGHRAQGAAGGPAALALAQSFQPDVVLWHLGLAAPAELDAVGQVRQVPGLAEALFLARIELGPGQVVPLGKVSNFNFVLNEPLDFDRLRELLASCQGRDS